MTRLTSAVRVSALIRRVHAEGGTAAVLARGDAEAGGILLLAYERGANPRFLEPALGARGEPALVPAGPEPLEEAAVGPYWQRRRERDSDLWVIELDVAEAERFAAETLLSH